MQVPLYQLERHLAEKPLAPVWLISGDEPLLVDEALSGIRACAREKGFAERKTFHVMPHFKWQDWLADAAGGSLFSEARLLEVHFQKSTIDKAGTAVLTSCLASMDESLVLVFTMPRLDGRSTKSKWYGALMKKGVHVPVWPVSLKEMPGWLEKRVRQAGLRLEPDAMKLLLDSVAGNLLAANQEITKLALFDSKKTWHAEAVAEIISDSARYTVFDLLNATLTGNLPAALKMLRNLEMEAEPPMRILAILGREWVSLKAMCEAVERGQSPARVMREHRVFKQRIPATERALQRLDSRRCEALLARLTWVEQSVKGLQLTEVWDALQSWIADSAGHSLFDDRLSDYRAN